MNRSFRLWLYLIVPVLGCFGGGCATGLEDPYRRDGTWGPSGINEANIAAMVAHPRDLAVGVDDPVSPAQLSAAAVNRLLTNSVKPLQQNDVGRVGGASSGGVGGGTATGAGQ